MNFEFHPLTPERWPDMETLFGAGGACGTCWCLFFRLPRAQYATQDGAANRQMMEAIVRSGTVPGLLAHGDGQVAAWCALGPREDFQALENSRNLRPIDDTPVWSIPCFFVAKPHRRQGMTRRLLEAAAAYARSHGAVMLEGYPIDPSAPRYGGKRLSGATGNEGIVSAFRAAGFSEARRASATQFVMRKNL